MLKQVAVPRWIFGEEKDRNKLSLHMFVDASQVAYAAALFVRIETLSGSTVHLVQSKSRVAPAEKTTIPRMELLAATLGARLMNSFLKASTLEFQEKIFWSDSSTVLWWLRKNGQWAKFVWNRVEEIRKTTDIKSWRHVPGIMNPADLPSRGCSPDQLVQTRWWEGPLWLRNSRNQWPIENFEVDQELVKSELVKSSQDIDLMDIGEYQVTLSNENVTKELSDEP